MIERLAEPAVSLRGLFKKFESEGISPWRRLWPGADGPPKPLVALDYVDLEVQRGEIFGVLGANGSGKSTLIRLVATLLLPDGGEVRVFGHDAVADELQVKRMMNRVSVEAAFFKKLSPMENLLYAARLYDLHAGAARVRIVEILTGLGIKEKRDLRAAGAHVARDAAEGRHRPGVADLAGPAAAGRANDRPGPTLEARGPGLRAPDAEQHDTTVVLTTHDMEEADRLCDRIAMIADGRIIAQDTPAGLKRLLSPDGTVSLEEVFMQLTGHGLEDEPAEDGRC